MRWRQAALIGSLWLLGWLLIVWPRVTAPLPGRFANDFEIYRDGTREFLAGRPLYKPDGARSPFNGFNGPPSTALVYAPFAFGSFATSLFWYRVTLSALFAFAVVIAAAALPRHRRSLGCAVGAAALVLWHPVFASVVMGQLDAWVTAALALGIYLASRDRWFGAGACFGAAALIKVSPALALVYCVLDRRWRALGGAVAVLVVAVLVTSSISPLSSWLYFATHVLPELPQEGMQLDNQSLPAVFARILARRETADGMGLWSALGPLVGLIGVAAVWRAGRKAQRGPFALGLVVLVALLAGPITWNHYETWALVPMVLSTDDRLWAGIAVPRRRWLALSAIAAACLFVVQFSPRPSGPIWLLSQLGTVGLMIQLGVGVSLLRASWSRT